MIERSKILQKDRLFRRFEQEDFNEKGLKSSAFSDPVDEPSVHLEKLADFYKIEKTYDETVAYGVWKEDPYNWLSLLVSMMSYGFVLLRKHEETKRPHLGGL